jgi:adenosine deaminase
LEDTDLVKRLRDEQIPLEVCPTSNICLKVFPSLEEHSLPKLVEEGLYVTINSDDPPMFNTTLTREYQLVHETFGYDRQQIKEFVLRALRVTLLPQEKKDVLEKQIQKGFQILE